MATEDIKDNLYFTFLQTSQKNSNTAQRITSWKISTQRGRKEASTVGFHCSLKTYLAQNS